MWELSRAHEIASQRMCPFACPGLKQAEQVEVITRSLILLVDLLPEQQWNICLADTVTEGDIWRVVESLSQHPRA